ncbi:MAG: fused MFS/spermidine synthase [Pseudomonadota bacterium]
MTTPTPPIGFLALKNARHLSPLYATALLVSALLLFWIQPLFTKMVLPRFGGSPAVWTTASMFFQVMLLAGYFYAHLISQKFVLRTQVLLHLALLAAVFLVLPIGLNGILPQSDAQTPIVSLLTLLMICLGLPFFVLSATAPLLQKWFSHTSHADAVDPYFLYSASNIGSMIALVGYPVVIEPALGLARQSMVWAGGYALLAVLIAVCAVNAWHQRDTGATLVAPVRDTAKSAVHWPQRIRWMLLALAPSSLLLGVTQHISTEIAAVPLLWLIPLSLYVLTFVNVFARRPLVRHSWMLKLQPMLVLLLALVWILNTYFSVFILHLAAFFVTAMMCHGELARTRPDASRLTEFYLWLSVGGALGGTINAVAAPLLFSSILEYPLAIGLACMLRPAPQKSANPVFHWSDIAFPLVLALAFTLLISASIRPFAHGAMGVVVYLQAIGLVLYLFHVRPIRFGLGVMVALIASPILHLPDHVLERHRSFFGVHTVLQDKSEKFHVLMHGITIHGAQYIAAGKRLEPTTYFHRDSPLGQLFFVTDAHHHIKRVGVIGLGVGTTACYRKPGQEWTFFEIDPVVVRLAKDTRYFSFLRDCAPDAKIMLGDGRLSVKAMPDRHFDLIIIDTFSSDAIPMHMITREALALYFQKLSEDGIVMFHVSNQYLDLAPVLANLAAAAGLAAKMPGPHLSLPPDDPLAQMESRWIAISRRAQNLALLESQEGWVAATPQQGARLWTDDFSNVLGALK